MNSLKINFITFILLLFSFNSIAIVPPGDEYRYSINLYDVKENKITVTLIPPALEKNEVIFHFPTIIPGTYHVYDFGRFVSNLKAYDTDGTDLIVSRIDSNSWSIKGGSISKITYLVEDSWNTANPNNRIFQPVGLNLETDKNYVINPPCLFGYIDEMKDMKFDISITKPHGFYGSTAIVPVFTNNQKDEFELNSYYDLADSPIMYSVPDTSIIKVGNTDVLISVYSHNKIVDSKFLAKNLKEILYGQLKYLGGKLPVNKYAYLIYFADQDQMRSNGAYGALEHNNSSMYFMPEGDEEMVKRLIVSPAAHEFFHIITPLTIHSNEIQNFDFEQPKMSEHLWLYEGVTEYSAMIFQVKEGLQSNEEFLKTVRDKMDYMDRINDTSSFTELSKTVLQRSIYEYMNVYNKGALIGMCLDLKLRELSNGKYGLRDLMVQLAKRYGKNKAFSDEELFDVITGLSYPEVRTFFKLYVEGSEPLPLKEYLSYAGIDYDKVLTVKNFSFGQVSLTGTLSNRYAEVTDISNMDEIGKELGLKTGDFIKEVNGIEVPVLILKQTMTSVLTNAKEGDELKLLVIRKDDSGKEKEITLKAKMRKVDFRQYNVMNINNNASEKQVMLRNAWLGEN